VEEVKHPYLQLHIAVFLFGFTAILGKYISLDQYNLVWQRMWIAGIAYFFVPGVLRSFRKLSKVDFLRFALIGVLVAIHWVTFYGSIKIGDSASLTLACFGTITLFTAILEPIMTKSNFKKKEFGISLLVLLGLYFVYLAKPKDETASNFNLAIVWGILSSFIAAVFSVLNKKWIPGKNTMTVSSVQLISGFLFLSALLPLLDLLIPSFYSMSNFQLIPSGADIISLLVLSILCTTLAFVFELNALKHVSAFVANLVINLEPVYGIIMAAVFFSEHKMLIIYFYIGATIIMLSVFLHPILGRFNNRRVAI
jgi:drug/metabolite transporter (DMT)-like permease